MPAEQSGQVIGVGKEPTVKGRSFKSQRKAAAFVRWHEPYESRHREVHVRICERLGVKLPGATRRRMGSIK